MKRRDFIKTTTCLTCAGAISCNNLKADASVISNIKTNLAERKFIYKSEKDLPTRIRIDICNLCQLNCAACWMREFEEEFKKNGIGFGYVPFDTYKNFIDKHPFIKEIELSNNGEIFLNPDLDKIIEYSYQKGIALSATNGVNLNTISEKTAENLVKYKFRAIDVSIDAATPETYPIYRRGGDFNTVINNIKMINKFKEKYNSEYPRMTYKFILFGHNEHEIDDAKVLAKKLNMDIRYEVNCVPRYSPLKNPEEVQRKTGLANVTDSIENAKDEFIEGKSSYFPCMELWRAPQIAYNGDISCCCLGGDSFGVNSFEKGLLNSLNDEKILYAKTMLSNLNVEPRKDIPCTKCFVYKNLKQSNTKIEFEKLSTNRE